jgi:hypothetical protein
MATSGTISTTTFQTVKVVDHAFRRCRLAAENITPEMQVYAQDLLYLLLSELANPRPPSWCIERQVYPMYQNQPVVTLDTGTVEVLNVNYLTLQKLEPASSTTTATQYTAFFSSATTVNSVGIKWLSVGVGNVVLNFEVSNDAGVTWTNVGSLTLDTSPSAGQWTWGNIAVGLPYGSFRVTSTVAFSASEIYLGNMPQEIPLGQLNRDTYTAQSNQVFPGRPVSYYFQRQQINPILRLWPAPNVAAEHGQLIVWRHRHIMDVGTLAQEIEVPQRWMEAVVAGLAAKVALETPNVDINLVPLLDQKAAQAMQSARDGDNDGSPTFIQPYISVYTR